MKFGCKHIFVISFIVIVYDEKIINKGNRVLRQFFSSSKYNIIPQYTLFFKLTRYAIECLINFS
jgi:hypothetical protein